MTAAPQSSQKSAAPSKFGIWHTVVVPFLLSRIVVMAILVGAPLVSIDSGTDLLSIRMRPRAEYSQAIRTALLPGDAVHYLDIAQHGYARFLSRGWFPLFPILWRSLARLTGEFPVTGALLSNGLFLIGLILLYRAIPLLGFGPNVAARTILYLSIFPASHFFSVPLTESLFLALSAGAFYAGLRGSWILAGLCGILASATRLPGALLAAPLLMLCWQGKFRLRNAVPVLLIPAGAIAYFTYLRSAFGDFFAYRNAQAAVMAGLPVSAGGSAPGSPAVHAEFFLSPLVRYALHPTVFHAWSFLPLQFATAVFALVCVWRFARRQQWVLALYLAASMVLPLSAGLFGSFTRFMMVCFPVTLELARMAEDRPMLDHAIRLTFAAFLALYTLACALKFGLAMA